MRTITAKELRDNLSQVVERVRRGEVIRVTYRSGTAFTIQPEKKKQEVMPGSPEAMRLFIVATDDIKRGIKPSLNPNKSVKEIYHELLDNDPKYKKYATK